MNRYEVEDVNYDGLVSKIAATEKEEDRTGAIVTVLELLPRPRLKAEREFFWKALHNATRKNEKVWLWFVNAFPQLDTGGGYFTMPDLTTDWQLPVIDPDGDEIDAEEENKASSPVQFSSEPTEENFQEQELVLEKWFKDNAKPCDRCQNVTEYIETIHHSGGTGEWMARTQLATYGLYALATPEGIVWLTNKYKK